MKKIIFAMLLIFITYSNALAVNWVYLGDSDDKKISTWVDSDSIQIMNNEGIFRLWSKMRFNDTGRTDRILIYFGPSANSDYCITIAQITYPNGQSQVTEFPVTGNDAFCGSIIPDSVMGEIYKFSTEYIKRILSATAS